MLAFRQLALSNVYIVLPSGIPLLHLAAASIYCRGNTLAAWL